MTGHIPVLCAELVEALAPTQGAVLVDGTFGRGGHSRALLAAADCRVIAIDRDPRALAAGRQPGLTDGRLTLICGTFGDMESLVRSHHDGPVHGVALDLGVSSPQIDAPERGFSFRHDGPLDMRMGDSGPTAADLVNRTEEEDLGRLIRRLGEERFARRVARAIVAARPLSTTEELARVVRAAVPKAADRIDPATRTFQAVRMAVNDELAELDRGLAAAERLLAPGGRLAVISFHSLEDRCVKRFLDERSGRTGAPVSRHLPPRARTEAAFHLNSRRAVRPGTDEIRANPRARSARMRLARRTESPARTDPTQTGTKGHPS